MADKLEITYTDDGKGKSHSHTARVDFVGFSVADFEAYGDTRAEADSELRTKLMSLRSAVDELLESPRHGDEPRGHVLADVFKSSQRETYTMGEAALRGEAIFVNFSGKLVLARGVYTGELKLYTAAEDLVPDERVVVRHGRVYRRG